MFPIQPSLCCVCLLLGCSALASAPALSLLVVLGVVRSISCRTGALDLQIPGGRVRGGQRFVSLAGSLLVGWLAWEGVPGCCESQQSACEEGLATRGAQWGVLG